MTKLQQLSQSLKALQKRGNIYRITLRATKKFEAYLIDLNQIQLSQGISIFGNVVGQYSEKTEERARTENTRQPKIAGQNYNFEWTGQFFDGMKIRFTGDYLEFISTAGDAEVILDSYANLFGEQVLLGLTTQNLDDFLQQKLIPELNREICSILDLPN